MRVGCCSLFRDVEEIEKLSELGVLFLLFEMGLELTIDKLRVRCWSQGAVTSGPGIAWALL